MDKKKGSIRNTEITRVQKKKKIKKYISKDTVKKSIRKIYHNTIGNRMMTFCQGVLLKVSRFCLNMV